MPSDSEQRLQHSYYRGCWHEFSRCFLRREFNPERYSLPGITPFQQSFTTLRPSSLTRSCSITLSRISGRFSTAASRRSLGSVSVPVWPDTLSGRLPVVALVGHHPTNKLIGRGPIPHRKSFPPQTMQSGVLFGIRPSFPGLSQSAGQITHVLLTRSPLEYPRRGLSVRLACVKHAASVRPEPGSNSPNKNPRTNRAESESEKSDQATRKIWHQKNIHP